MGGTIVSASLRPFIPRLHLDYRLLNHSWGDSGNQESGGGSTRECDTTT
jgi:hypothetical protein